jgi:alpha-tubulin suppressor-like RCC1 family protein
MRALRLLLVAATALAAACLDDRTIATAPTTPAAPDGTTTVHAPLQLALDAHLVAAAPALDVRIYYLRSDGTTGDLLRRRVALVSGTQQVTLTVDPGPCLADARRLATGGSSACVVGAALTLLNDAGAASDSTAVLPVEVAAGDTRTLGGADLAVGQSQWKQVSVGGYTSCGLWRDGAVWCWGNGETGQLGTIAAAQRAPVRVAASARFAKVSAGLGAACALTPLGEAWCWGLDVYGGLGRGSVSTQRCTSPTVAARAEVSGTLPCAPTPQRVTGGLTFRDITVGAMHACAISAAGRVYCWGLQAATGAGGGSASGQTPVPQPTAISGARTYESISAGALHTCAVTATGAAYCWGANESGELGNGTSGANAFSLVPVPVSGGLTFRAVSAGWKSTCGVTLTNEAYCWGTNEHLQSGVDSRTSDASVYSSPRRVALSQPVAQISAGWESVCAVTTAGAGYCWGSHALGKLGIGATAPQRCTFGTTTFACSPLPTAVIGGQTFTRVEVGIDGACGVTRAGAAYCWGSDEFGQLGAARPSGSPSTPTPLAVRVPSAG